MSQTLAVKDGNNATQTLSMNVDPTNGNALIGTSSLTDPATGQKANIVQFHTSDNQSLGGSAYGINTGGVAQLLNVAGNLDRQREVGLDGVAAVGLSSSGANFAMTFKTSVAGGISIGSNNVTPGAMSGTIGGVPWSIQVGSVLFVDTGTNLENVLVTAVTTTQFTATFAKTHSGTVVVRGNVYNQERDVSGEADGATGIGTAVAAEYEYNAGAPGGGNFDRARNLQGKGKTTATVSSGGTQGSTSIVVSAAGTIKAGMQVLLYKAANFPIAGYFETVYVDLSYTEGSTTVPLLSAIVNSVGYDTIAYDAFSAVGPGLTGFLPIGVGIEEEALYDPVSGLYYVERAATSDACAPQNVVIENPGLFNGTTVDRARSAPGGLGVALVSSDGAKATYGVIGVAITPAATPTDVVNVVGSATKTLRVKRVAVSGLATTAGSIDVSLVKRTAVNTGGTSSAPTIGQHDSSDAAATGTVAQYSVNPTGLGAGVAIKNQKLNLGLSGASGTVSWDFSTRNDKAVVLRGVAQSLAINLNGQALPAGAQISYEIEFEEDNS